MSLPDGVKDELEQSFNTNKDDPEQISNSSLTPAGSNIGEYYQML